MKTLILLALALSSFSLYAADIIGYLPNYRVNEQTLKRAKLCTDIVYFGSELTESGKIKTPAEFDEHLTELHKLCKKHKIRLQLCLGGWAKDKHFPTVTASETKRENFLTELKAIQEKYHIDGVDYDWEYPRTKEEMTNFVKLCSATKSELGNNFLVTAAFPPSHKIPLALTESLDRIHLMTYDLPGKHCDISYSKKAIKDWKANKVPENKICIGTAFYARKIDQRDEIKTYAQLINEYGVSKVRNMPVDGYFSDNQSSCQAKARLVRKEKVRGVIIWELGQDSNDRSSLLLSLSRALK